MVFINTVIMIIKEFEGIFGAILGSTVTLIVTHILKRKGEIIPYLIFFSSEYITQSYAYGEPNEDHKDKYICNIDYKI